MAVRQGASRPNWVDAGQPRRLESLVHGLVRRAWRPEDLPALRVVIRLYDEVQRGRYQRAAELRMAMDGWGITPAGRQARRWLEPEESSVPPTSRPTGPTKRPKTYAHLRVLPRGDAS